MKSYIIKTNSTNNYYSKKHVFQSIEDKSTFEASSFYRPNMNRYDLCISSSAGCSLGCKICQCTYSKFPYERKLSSIEMIDQIEFLLSDGRNFFDNKTMILITFMGNGEPFLNINEVLKTISFINNKYGKLIYRFGLSTIGVNINAVKEIIDLSLNENITIWLQYSMISMDNNIRHKILPHSPLFTESLPYLDLYALKTGNPTRYNYPIIKDINDSKEHLDQIIQFINEKPKLRMVKISTYNEISEKKFIGVSDEILEEMANYLRDNGVKVDIFYAERSEELKGGCGQMRDTIDIMECKSILDNKISVFTHNQNKLELINSIAKDNNIDILKIKNLTSSIVGNVENIGKTYLDHALLKAKKGFELTNTPCIATDYGMEILELDRKPGIETERWMNSTSDASLINETIKSISNIPSSKRITEFVGVGVIMLDNNSYLYSRESDIGLLLDSPKGNIINGHPLSSLLYIPDKEKTLSELNNMEFISKDIRIYSKLLKNFNFLRSFLNTL